MTNEKIAEPTLEELRAARKRAMDSISPLEINISYRRFAEIQSSLFDAAIARAERKESGEYVEVRMSLDLSAYSDGSIWASLGAAKTGRERIDDPEPFEWSAPKTGKYTITALVPIPKPAEIEGEVEDG